MPIIDPIFAFIMISFVVLLAWAAVTDVRSFTIPNRINLAILALYPVYVVASPGAVDWTGGLVCGLVAFGIGAFMFAMRWIGGGDVKMIAVASVWAGPAFITEMILIICLIGGIHSILEGVRGGYPARYWRLAKNFAGQVFGSKLYSSIGGGTQSGGAGAAEEKTVFVPYGVAIFAGGLYVAVNLIKSSV